RRTPAVHISPPRAASHRGHFRNPGGYYTTDDGPPPGSSWGEGRRHIRRPVTTPSGVRQRLHRKHPMPLIDFKTSATNYAAHSLGVRRAYDTADAYMVGRFTFSDELDAYPWGRRVPAVAHVWEHLILPTLDPEAPINEAAIRADLDALPRR